MPDKSLDWPGSAVSKSTDGVALNLDLEVLLNSFKLVFQRLDVWRIYNKSDGEGGFYLFA